MNNSRWQEMQEFKRKLYQNQPEYEERKGLPDPQLTKDQISDKVTLNS